MLETRQFRPQLGHSAAKPAGVGAASQRWDYNGRTIWIADAHRDDGKRFVVHAEEKLTAFLELESAIQAGGELPRQAGEIFPNSPDMKPSIPPALITLALVCFALALHITCH